MEAIVLHFIFVNWHRLNEIGYVRLVKSQLLSLIYDYFIILFVHSGILILVVFLCCCCAIKINLWQLKHTVTSQNGFDLRAKLLWYRKVFIKTLLYMLVNNRHMGTLFFVFLIVNFPVNCYFLLQMKNSTNVLVQIIILLLFIEQVFVIFGIHGLIASLNSQFSKNLKYFVCELTTNNGLKLKSNLKINLFVQTFQTRKKYGFTYAKFGLISMLAFTKVKLFNRKLSFSNINFFYLVHDALRRADNVDIC